MRNSTEEKKYNICRPIVLFNNFLPTLKEKNGWEYMAFGTIDGVSVEEAIVSESSGKILSKLWEHQKEYSAGLKGKAAVQIIYGLCHGEVSEESDFWADAQYPFTFFCRLQFRGNIDSLRKNRFKIEEIIKNEYDVLIKIYTMYDNSDLLIVIKAEKYSDGVSILNSLHQDVNFAFDNDKLCELKNSFTIFALKQEYINRTIEDKFVEGLNRDTIKKAYVNIVKRRCSERADWQKLIGLNKDKIEEEFVLGTDDEVVFLNNIGWGDFLKLYRDDTGIFNNSSPEYQQFIAGAATIICVDLEQNSDMWKNWKIKKTLENRKDNELVESETYSSQKTNGEFYRKYIDKLRDTVDELNKQSKNRENGIYKELYVILNILPKFSEEVFSDYVFFVILRPFDTLLELLKGKFNDSYYEFIKNFNLFIQNSVKSDKHAMQIMDFNTKIYDIPTKLNAFYTVYIYNISDILNIAGDDGKPHWYDFIVVPGVTNKVNVVELFQRVSDNKRLLRIEIPENRFYDIDNIMLIFAHEAGHYVGTAIRKRDERYEYILCSIAHIYIDYIMSYLMEDNKVCINLEESEWQNIKDRCKHLLERTLERTDSEEYLRKRSIGESQTKEEDVKQKKEYSKRYKKYFSFLEKNVFVAMSDITEYMLPNIFGGMVYDMSEKERNRIYQILKEISIRFLERYEERTTIIRLDTVLEQLNNLYEECFSDIIAITLLDLDAGEYLNSIIKENELQGRNIDYLRKTEVIYRIGIVLNVMGTQTEIEKLNFYESDEYLKERISILKAAREMLQCVEKGWWNILDTEQYRNCSLFALMNKDIYDMAFKYLVECRKEFIQKINEDGNRKKKCDRIRDFFSKYKTSKESNIEDQIVDIEEMIEEYKNKLSKEIECNLTQ